MLHPHRRRLLRNWVFLFSLECTVVFVEPAGGWRALLQRQSHSARVVYYASTRSKTATLGRAARLLSISFGAKENGGGFGVLRTKSIKLNGARPCQNFVEKMSTSADTRFLYIAGLTGSGLQAFSSFIAGCTNCRLASHETTRLFAYKAGTNWHGIFNLGGNDSVTSRKIRSDRKAFVERLKHEAMRPGLVLLNSPPTLRYAGPYLKHPNVHILAALAEIAGVDLRIFVMDRPGQAIIATMTKRGRMSNGVDVATLADNAAVLKAHVNMISPNFVRRVPLDQLANESFWSAEAFDMVSFAHPALASSEHVKNMTDSVSRQSVVDSNYVSQQQQHNSQDEKVGLQKSNPTRAQVSAMIDGLSASLEGRQSVHFIRKTRFSRTTRVVFVAGLEGTGHHATKIFFDNCRRASLCIAALQLSALLYSGGNKAQGIFPYPEDSAPFAAIKQRRMEFLHGLARLSNASKLIVLNTLSELNTQKGRPLTGMMSYPNFAGKFRAFQHVDVHEIASLAESAGIDFRVLVLSRPAKEILVSTTEHRHFDSRPQQAAVLADDAAALAAQLQLLDSSFMTCIPYSQIGNATWWNEPYKREPVSGATQVFRNTSHAPSEEAPASLISPAEWLHPGLPAITDRSVATIYSGHVDKACDSSLPNTLELATFFENDEIEASLAAALDYLHRTAGCMRDV